LLPLKSRRLHISRMGALLCAHEWATMSGARQAEAAQQSPPREGTMSFENRPAGPLSPPDVPGTGQPELPFARLRHYQILARVGRGGMGDVYLAYEEGLRRRVAI